MPTATHGPRAPIKRPPEQRYAAAGFTLLEVMVAVAILSLSLTSLLTSQMASMRATRYAQTITSVAFLADYQLIETEYTVRKEGGWVLEDKFYEGSFADQGWPEVKYKCIVDFLKLPEFTELREAKDESDRANRGESSVVYKSAGDKAFSSLGMVWTPVKQAIERAIRKVKCTVTWKNGNVPEEFIVNTFWADPEKLKQLPGLGGEVKEGDADDQAGGGGGAGGRPGGTSSGAGPGQTAATGGRGGRGGGGPSLGGTGK